MPPDPDDIDQQQARLTEQFRDTFGRAPTLIAAAPGRVNLIGEHTDYNDGYVLPLAIGRQTLIAATPRQDRQARLFSTGEPEGLAFSLDEPLQPGEPKWGNYVRGVVAGAMRGGLNVSGFDALVDSTVPTGGGLSSSAALEVAAATLMEALAGRSLQPIEKALLCQQAEHEYAGMPCGIMDQFISVMGRKDHALLIDCRTHQTRQVPLDDPSMVILIANTNVKHELTGGEYAQRRSECEQAARALGVPALRDATLESLAQQFPGKEAGPAFQRARHVITENARTLELADALASRNWRYVGDLMWQSHLSLRDDFEVSCQELDLLVELAERRHASGEVAGSRMTGGGFGGCTVSLVGAEAVETVKGYLGREYHAVTGIDPTFFITRPAEGARLLAGG